ncbi:hypothetical protein [Cupriavidus nantongensis]|uniref:Uncharacterized protein n=1 Tax=Cupriavidus nantongensis TaxID=1796606 RepID=A0A142JKD5_9BURK|nr:hypothetical protein [Cupriavidus nantongensis]AMR78547.1 hypothetical protein A2G96_12800 [Cupriavidus nantongensis]
MEPIAQFVTIVSICYLAYQCVAKQYYSPVFIIGSLGPAMWIAQAAFESFDIDVPWIYAWALITSIAAYFAFAAPAKSSQTPNAPQASAEAALAQDAGRQEGKA